MPDLQLCLGVLKHMAPLARGGGHLPAKKNLRWVFAYVVQFLTIPKFPVHVCLTACVVLPGLPPSGPK